MKNGRVENDELPVELATFQDSERDAPQSILPARYVQCYPKYNSL